jgi:cobyrinic acid a,c-diamide synthase
MVKNNGFYVVCVCVYVCVFSYKVAKSKMEIPEYNKKKIKKEECHHVEQQQQKHLEQRANGIKGKTKTYLKRFITPTNPTQHTYTHTHFSQVAKVRTLFFFY